MDGSELNEWRLEGRMPETGLAIRDLRCGQPATRYLVETLSPPALAYATIRSQRAQ
jgi:hypothetical protein